ncbi:thioredoxin-dependent thiol peroxidase [Paenibacillus macquariensis]|uniref:thioredoxin-dependent peroxiredoxin n=1 Tax=Paenibacillus macquariensis TaxID=948756 RepID=A0ABY1KBQ3_9BACL|nr:thioredoxin-dependent thiol peroxidase [Paenibacillus macquariensis]MEC0093557.1 thioredoxin-dependent thiol peroxidase [Paenibacillus macquariensis]OAB29836.1 peroxiredoxin [Paenibacillus macquariensis subsp. macquariensis]SIR56527.1 peroxiredoxin Q/BCP [Paenibacillus macquariensis]
MELLQIGQSAPTFTLMASNGEKVSLSDYLGRKVVLYFYPKNMTPGCTTEACNFRDANSDIENLGAVILGISPDEVKSHGKFIERNDLPFLLLSDVDHAVSELYGVWQLKKMYGREYLGIVRSTFLIDEDGILMKEWRKVKVAGHSEEVLTTLQLLGQ